jgi:hypothetical protein
MAGDRDTERSLRRLNAAEKRQEKGSKIMVLSTGVELEALVVPPMLLTDIAVEAVDRDEENPDDPVFKEALSNWQAGVLIDLNNAYILVGTRLVSKPDGLPGWDDADWLDEMKLLGRRVGSRRQRYLAWIKYVAAPTGEDITLIVREVGRLSGVSERDVQESIDGFQREGARDAGDGAGAQARGERGDHVLDPAP